MNTWIKNGAGVIAIATVALGTGWAVQHYHKPGQLDVISAQAMEMSQMRPPTGAAPVALASVRTGALADTVTYTGTVIAYNEQDISPRITGMLVSLPVYPGDSVRTGQIVAQLDTAEIEAKADQASQEAREAQLGAQVAHLTHRLHHQAALAQAAAQVGAAQQSVSEAQAEAQADQDAISDTQAGVQSAQANADYWKTEIAREKQLADAGAASRQEYQSELAQAQTAQANLAQAKAKVSQARAMAASELAKIRVAKRQVSAVQAGLQMAQADIAVAQGQAVQAEAGASAARAAAQAAAVQQGYSRITSAFDGVVTARPVAPGTLVQPGTVVLKIEQIDRVRVQASVAVEDIAGIHAGSPVHIILQGSGRAIAAHVTSVFPSASDQTRTATVEAVVSNPGHFLMPGGFVTMQIANGAAASKLLVPASAVVTQGGASRVWLATGVANAAPTRYRCEKCGMIYSAADARRNHYIDPMDGGKLAPVASTLPAAGLTAHAVTVTTAASDGTWTEVSSNALSAGARVVTHGQAGLTEGTQLAATEWGTDGPKMLPTASAAMGSRTVYRCEKCGMTYSETDARRNHYVDPMDGGRLIPMRGN